MSKRKRTFVDAKDIEVGECFIEFGTIQIVTKHEMSDRGVFIDHQSVRPGGFHGFMNVSRDDPFKVPRHFHPMFPNSRAEMLARDPWEDHDE